MAACQSIWTSSTTTDAKPNSATIRQNLSTPPLGPLRSSRETTTLLAFRKRSSAKKIRRAAYSRISSVAHSLERISNGIISPPSFFFCAVATLQQFQIRRYGHTERRESTSLAKAKPSGCAVLARGLYLPVEGVKEFLRYVPILGRSALHSIS